MDAVIEFPVIAAHDLEGRDLVLPEAFVGLRNVVIVAFRRHHQELVDSWIPWLEEQSRNDADLRFYELPTISRIWNPVRSFIDGGMAAAIRTPKILQRTLTIYGDVRRLTAPLGITDRATISLFLVDDEGHVHWSGAGPYTEATGRELGQALDLNREQSESNDGF